MIEHQVAVLRRKSAVGHCSYREILPDVICPEIKATPIRLNCGTLHTTLQGRALQYPDRTSAEANLWLISRND
jgi:hypothetical protein